jgi:chemotaxis protein MotB
MKRVVGAPTVNTGINYWPAMIDMLTSMLMFFLLLYFVEHRFGARSAELANARQRQQEFAALFQDEFRDEIAAGDISVTEIFQILQIRFGERVLFRTGSSELLPQGESIMGRLARVLSQAGGGMTGAMYEQIQIEGHTDDQPLNSADYPHDNWELSTARAMAVLQFLTRRATSRLEEDRMSVNGYAQTRPVDLYHRAPNRRIELRIYFSGKPA